MPKKRTQTEFIELANIKHNNFYIYDKVKYINNTTKVSIKCPIHKKYFDQIPKDHLNGRGCSECGGTKKLTKTEFIKKAKQIHSNYYDYTLVDYINYRTDVIIICKKHNNFNQTPEHHLQGHGCQTCKNSKGELKIYNYLINNDINFKSQYKVDFLSQRIFFDFYIPSLKCFIEFDGIQHFTDTGWGKYEIANKQDLFKNAYVAHINKTLIRIHYKDYNNIENILNNLLNKNIDKNIHFSRKKYYK